LSDGPDSLGSRVRSVSTGYISRVATGRAVPALGVCDEFPTITVRGYFLLIE